MSTADQSPAYTQCSPVHTKTSCSSKRLALSVKLMERLLWFAVGLLASFRVHSLRTNSVRQIQAVVCSKYCPFAVRCYRLGGPLCTWTVLCDSFKSVE
jgi:hypothetical protein